MIKHGILTLVAFMALVPGSLGAQDTARVTAAMSATCSSTSTGRTRAGSVSIRASTPPAPRIPSRRERIATGRPVPTLYALPQSPGSPARRT